MGKLRDLMGEELDIRGYSVNTREEYLGCVHRYTRYFMRPPDELGLEDVRRYQVHLTKVKKVAWSTFNVAVCAIRFFYRVALKKDWDVRHIPYQKTRRKLPEILSEEEVTALFDSVSNLKHRAILMTAYSGGLRVSEVVRLRVSDIDSKRMVIRIDDGKGNKDRYVKLSQTLLPVLRAYWRRDRPARWLFPGQNPNRPLSREAAQEAFRKARNRVGICKRVSIHSLRHAYATHLLEAGENICVIQKLLGHRSLRSTQVYTHVAKNYLEKTRSPLDRIGGKPPSPPRPKG